MVEGRLDRIEEHLRLLKKSEDEKIILLLSIQSSLIGSPMNGNKGVISSLQNIIERLEKLEDTEAETQVYLKQSKFLIVVFIGAFITILADMFQRKN
jgi:hypothetical protein